MGIYIGDLILDVILQYIVSASFSWFLQVVELKISVTVCVTHRWLHFI